MAEFLVSLSTKTEVEATRQTLRRNGFVVKEKKGYLVVRSRRSLLEVEAEHVGLLKTRALDGLTEEFSGHEGEKFASYRSDDFFHPWERAWLAGSLLAQLLPDATIYPLHDRSKLDKISIFGASVSELTRYFGPRIGAYFAWMNAFTSWLVGPAVVGVVLYLRRLTRGLSIDDDPCAPFFSLFIIVWSALFETWWPRTEARFKHDYGVFTLTEDRFLADQTFLSSTHNIYSFHDDLHDDRDDDDDDDDDPPGRRHQSAEQERTPTTTTTSVRKRFFGSLGGGSSSPEKIQTSPVSAEELLREKKKMQLKRYASEKRLQMMEDSKVLRRQRYQRRIFAYILSILVTALMLVIALAWHLVSLNVQGYVQQITWIERYAYLEGASSFGRTLLMTDPTGLSPTLIHVLVVRLLNQVYRFIATKLTKIEHHDTIQAAENALVLKRFLFEAFDAYAALFYLAFIDFDIVKLRSELVSIYSVDALRRFATESLLPAIFALLGLSTSGRRRRRRRNEPNSAKTWQTKIQETLILEDEDDEQMFLTEYENFDDYLEMVIEFGYVTLFAAAFPLGAALSLACNVLEMKNDVLKLLFVTRRPWPGLSRTASTTADVGASIGVWHAVLKALVWLGVVTNTALFAFTSDQMAAWLPTPAFTFPAQGVLLAFALEHIVALIVLLIHHIVPPVPELVLHDHARRNAEKLIVAKQLRKEKLRTLADDRAETNGHDDFLTRRYC